MKDSNLVKFFWRIIPKKIYALIGSAGTGKSFRSFLLAKKHNIEYIIDDGLLIKDQKIIAGKSAKKEKLKVTAVKRAIFIETKHARDVRKTLQKERYTSLLIIATSDEMLEKIKKRLHLPKISKIIRIEDIATEEEILRAQKSRFKDGKHVMPLPLVEVKKRYPNIVLHAIHMFVEEPQGFFFKKKKKKLIEKTIVRPDFGGQGSVSISETALVQMVSHCIAEYSDNVKLIKIVIEQSKTGYKLKLKLSIKLHSDNKNIYEIQTAIKETIEEFTGIIIEKVDMHIVKVTQ